MLYQTVLLVAWYIQAMPHSRNLSESIPSHLVDHINYTTNSRALWMQLISSSAATILILSSRHCPNDLDQVGNACVIHSVLHTIHVFTRAIFDTISNVQHRE